jgi:hypothetical protein
MEKYELWRNDRDGLIAESIARACGIEEGEQQSRAAQRALVDRTGLCARLHGIDTVYHFMSTEYV